MIRHTVDYLTCFLCISVPLPLLVLQSTRKSRVYKGALDDSSPSKRKGYGVAVPKLFEVLDYLGKGNDTCHGHTTNAYLHWLLDPVTYCLDSDHGQKVAPLSYKIAAPVTIP